MVTAAAIHIVFYVYACGMYNVRVYSVVMYGLYRRNSIHNKLDGTLKKCR